MFVFVAYVFGSLLFLGSLITLGQNVFSCKDIFLHHFTEVDIVNLDEMSRHSVMKETWWEHHIISVVPELNTILTIKGHHVSCSVESTSSKDHTCAPSIDPEATIVDWTIAVS